MKHRVLLGLGSSLGEREWHLSLGIQILDVSSGIKLQRVSRTYKSVPLGIASSLFLNQCCIIETSLSPFELLEEIKKTEQRVGRRNSRRWSDRVLDIDILLFDRVCMDHPNLKIPHPCFLERAFVIQPAQEIAGRWDYSQRNCLVMDLPVPLPRCWCV
jgi:2-amino-4-hydroxy-6-hydroxymethyldihydropteridine diphosphokinase